MSTIAIFKQDQCPQLILSANTPDYDKDPDVIVNPDISLVKNIETKYWKRSGNSIIEMSQVEKDAVDQSELNARKSLADSFNAKTIEIFTAIIKVINLRLPSGQKITKQELIDAIKAEIV